MWKKVNIACKLYSCDNLHLSHSTASCDGVRLVVKFCLFWIYDTRLIRLDHDYEGSFIDGFIFNIVTIYHLIPILL